MAHQESIVVEIDGLHYVVPTKAHGKKLSPKDAVAKAREFHSLGRGYSSKAEATERAERKSQMADPRDKRLGKVSH